MEIKDILRIFGDFDGVLNGRMYDTDRMFKYLDKMYDMVENNMVRKKSGKPFKCGKNQLRYMGVVDHPYKVGVKAYDFGDGYVVECDKCEQVRGEFKECFKI